MRDAAQGRCSSKKADHLTSMIRHSQGPDMIESGYPIPSQGVDLVLGEDHSKDPLMIISVPRYAILRPLPLTVYVELWEA